MWETVVDSPEVLIAVRNSPDIGGGKVDWKEGAAVAIISKIKSGVFALKHQISSYCVVSESWSGIWLVSFGMIWAEDTLYAQLWVENRRWRFVDSENPKNYWFGCILQHTLHTALNGQTLN